MNAIPRLIVLVAVAVGAGGPDASAQGLTAPALPAVRADAPVPRFADPDRRAKLLAALPKIDEAVRQRREQFRMPGLFYGIVIDGELVASNAFGLRDVESQAPFTAATISRIASMTKSFTALAILKLRDAGKLGLDDPIARYLPQAAQWDYPARDSAPITVRQLMMHAGGFPEDNPWGDRQLAIPEDTLDAWVREGLPFSTAPGTAYEYSNYGFALLGRIVTVVSGVPYADYISREILRPLGMNSTFWEVARVPPDRVAQGYRWQDDRWEREAPLPHGAFGAMGGLYTSGEDLARYVAFHMAAWPPRDDPDTGPVRRSSVREMQLGWQYAGFTVDRAEPGAPLEASTGAYGFGLRAARECRTGFSVAHGGGLPGFGSHMLWLPEHGVGVIALANVTYAPASVVTRDIITALAATGALKPRTVPPSSILVHTRDRIARLLDRWDDALAAQLAADNLFLDKSADRRRAEVEGIRSDVGTCSGPGELEPENWLRARFRVPCERGWVDVAFTLAPTQPPRVQSLRFEVGRPLSERMRALATDVIDVVNRQDDAAAARAFMDSEDAKAAGDQLRAVHTGYGTCRIGDTVAGDGDTRARIRIECERGRVDAILQRGPDRRLRGVRLVRAAGESCIP